MREAVERLLENDEFALWTPGVVEIVEKAGENIDETRPIGGWCSTEDLDRQDEVVVAKGLDFSEFVSFGYFNDNHKQDTSSVLGYPRTAMLKGDRWYTEGNLITGYPPADKVWELAKALSKSRAPRRLGFSIEGKVLQRDGGNRIVRAKVRNVAITNCPVNTACTWDIISKAFSTEDRVEQAAHKALAQRQALVQSGAAVGKDVAFLRADSLSFGEAVDRLQRLRPHYSAETCARVVSYAMNR